MDENAVSRGRPRLNYVSRQYRITLTLHLGEDDTLIEIIESIPKRKRAMMLKALILTGGISQNQRAIAHDENIDETIEGLVY